MRSAEQSQRAKNASLGSVGRACSGTSHAMGRCVRALVSPNSSGALDAGDNRKDWRATGSADVGSVKKATPSYHKTEIFGVAIVRCELGGLGY